MARAMKDSGIAWIGEIAEDFEVIKLKYLCDILDQYRSPITADQRNQDADVLYDYYGASGAIDKIDGYTIDDHVMLIGEDGANLKMRNLPLMYEVNGKAWINNHAHILKPKSEVDFYYLFYALEALDLNTYITGSAQPKLSQENLKNIWIPIPRHDIQNKISMAIREKCQDIDALIEQTRASIDEYKKLKQAVITQAVTKGIRPNRPMKDSGVDWIGMVPNDWQVTKLKYFATIRSGITLGKVYPAGTKLVEYPYLRVANVQGSYTDLRDVATIAVTEEEADKYRLHYGELLMTEGGDRDKLGRGAVWHGEIDPCLHQNHVFALRTNDKLLAEYVSYLSDSTVGRDYFDVTANQSVHLASTNSTTILNFIIPYPSINEQSEIVAFLDQEISEIDTVMHSKQRLLSSLDCLKRSIINEYVTGKKEVFSC